MQKLKTERKHSGKHPQSESFAGHSTAWTELAKFETGVQTLLNQGVTGQMLERMGR